MVPAQPETLVTKITMQAAINELIQDVTADWARAEPASEEALRAVISQLDFDLPSDYLHFLRYCNGGEGELSIPPYWFQIWPAEDVVDANQGYRVANYLPGYFAFGSSGGGELFVFNTRQKLPWRVYSIPVIPMNEKLALEVAHDFQSFVAHMGRRGQ